MSGRTFIVTHSGLKFYPLEPRVELIRAADIAHALSNLCRFTGHCEGFWSVASHCVLVSDILEPGGARLQLIGLLHDGAEAYLNDLSAPLKHSDALNAYCNAETRCQEVVWSAFGLRPTQDERIRVHEADKLALAAEARDLMQPIPEWKQLPDPDPIPTIRPESPDVARARWMKTFVRLANELRKQK